MVCQKVEEIATGNSVIRQRPRSIIATKASKKSTAIKLEVVRLIRPIKRSSGKEVHFHVIVRIISFLNFIKLLSIKTIDYNEIKSCIVIR